MESTNNITGNNATGSTTKTNDEAKVLFLGAARVGKTSIVQRFLYNRFDSRYVPTVEDVHLKKYIVRNNLVKLFLMDTSGSHYFPAMLRLCITKANAFVLVFSHDDLESLNKVTELLEQIRTERKDCSALPGEEDNGNKSYPPITVVCNKSDLSNESSQINESTIMEWLHLNNLKPSQFVYSSAKTDESIKSIFESLWMQNMASGSIQFTKWDQRRASLNSNLPLVSAVNGGESLEKGNDQRRPHGIFRNSLRLSKKSNKYKADVIHLDCTIQ